MNRDRDRLLRLLLAHRGMLLGYVLAIVRDFHLAEDVFQEASLIVLNKGACVKADAEFPRWARTVFRFEALNALRKGQKGPELLEPAILDLLEDPWCSEDGLKPRTVALRECIDKLSPNARRLIELRHIAGIPGNMVAKRLKKPANTIYVALSRTYRSLSACVKKRLAYGG